MIKAISKLPFGPTVLEFIEFLGDYSTFIWVAMKRTLSPPWRGRMVIDQLYLIGVKSFPIAMITAIFVGMVMTLQTGVQLVKFGSKGYVPGISWIANAREMVPAFVGIVVGARVAASITAEVGTMRVTEQIDALEVLNVDPIRYLVAPRVIAMTIMMPLITAVCLVGGYIGGTLVAASALQIDYVQYYMVTKKFAYMQDLYSGLFKTIFFGILIAVTGSYYGFRTRGGAEGVGLATTSSVVLTLLTILVSNYFLTSILVSLMGNLG